MLADVGDGRVLARTGPGQAVDVLEELLRHEVRVRLVADDGGRAQAHGVGEHHVRSALLDEGRQLRGDLRRHHARRIDVVVLRVDGQLVADGELGRFACARRCLHVHGALQGRLRRQLVDGRHGAQQLDLLLLSLDGTRERQPGAERLAGGHLVGLDRQRLGDPHPPRRDRALAGGEGRVAHLRVVRMGELERAVIEVQRGGLALARLGADPEQVRGAAVEPAALAVDHPCLDQSGLVPARELLVGQVRDVAAESLLGRGFVEAEVQPDAAHALALELQRHASVGIQAGVGQRRGDGRFRTGEVARVHQRHDVGGCGEPRTDVRGTGRRILRGRGQREQPRRERRGERHGHEVAGTGPVRTRVAPLPVTHASRRHRQPPPRSPRIRLMAV